jgi:prevent-host-death family protein
MLAAEGFSLVVRDRERKALVCILAKEHAMGHKVIKRLPTTEVKAHLEQIVHEVATTGTPVVVQTHGEDQAVIISLHDFSTMWSVEAALSAPARQQVRATLQAAGLLSQPTEQEITAVQDFEATHSPAEQQRMLARWRQLKLSPVLSEIILQNREQGSE